MKKELYESQKNYLTCGILMIIVGIVMFFMPKTVTLAWVCIGLGILFVIGFVILLKKDGLREVDDSEGAENTKKRISSVEEKEAES